MTLATPDATPSIFIVRCRRALGCHLRVDFEQQTAYKLTIFV